MRTWGAGGQGLGPGVCMRTRGAGFQVSGFGFQVSGPLGVLRVQGSGPLGVLGFRVHSLPEYPRLDMPLL